jgi:dTDP-glucose pyrophosphorylase
MKKIIAMIPAAGRGSRMLSLTEDMPKAMLPLHNKPIIGWHLDKLLEERITDVCIIVGYKKEKLIDYVDKTYSDKMHIVYAEQKELKGLAHAISYGITAIETQYKLNEYGLLIILGDTIIKDPINHLLTNASFIGYKTVDDYKRWCLIKTNSKNCVYSFVDKPDIDPETRKAVIGIYYFSNISILDENITHIIKQNITIKNEFQLSSAMEEYLKLFDIHAVEFNKWFDCGEVETFNNTRKNITRHFNSISVTNDNTIIKKSENENKIKQEINWYLNIPNKLRVYVPQLIDYSGVKDKTFYELEYINFNPMQELFLYNLPDLPEWDKFFKNTFKMIERFNLYSTKARYNSAEHLNDVLINKTQDRVDELLDNSQYWLKLMQKDSIRINGKLHKNWAILESKVYDYIEHNISNNSAQHWQIIHGDLFFGNMLYDINSSTLKVIDPRGNFGLDGIYGDIRYDLAKLNHSIAGKYDFIVNGLYALTKDDSDFEYILYDSSRHSQICDMFENYIKDAGYDMEHITVITAILFLSMIPLHSENFNNQKMFYLKAIELFNKIF